MDFEKWWEQRLRQSSAIIVAMLMIVFVAWIVLRYSSPTTLLYLFLWDLFHQILFYLGGIVALLDMLLVKWLDTSIERRLFTGIALACLFIACFQAWIDEHHNSEELIQEKAQIATQEEFWKNQSYTKDDALRLRDSLLAQNVTTLGQTQQSMNDLSKKILDVTKPEPLRMTVEQIVKPADPRAGYQLQQFIIFSNKVTPAKGDFSCGIPLTDVHAFVVGKANTFVGGTPSAGGFTVIGGGTIVRVDILTPIMTPTSPLVVSFLIPSGITINSCYFKSEY